MIDDVWVIICVGIGVNVGVVVCVGGSAVIVGVNVFVGGIIVDVGVMTCVGRIVEVRARFCVGEGVDGLHDKSTKQNKQQAIQRIVRIFPSSDLSINLGYKQYYSTFSTRFQ
jgi:hypothetical protein